MRNVPILHIERDGTSPDEVEMKFIWVLACDDTPSVDEPIVRSIRALTLLPTYCNSFVCHGIGPLAFSNKITRLNIDLIPFVGGRDRERYRFLCGANR